MIQVNASTWAHKNIFLSIFYIIIAMILFPIIESVITDFFEITITGNTPYAKKIFSGFHYLFGVTIVCLFFRLFKNSK